MLLINKQSRKRDADTGDRRKHALLLLIQMWHNDQTRGQRYGMVPMDEYIKTIALPSCRCDTTFGPVSLRMLIRVRDTEPQCDAISTHFFPACKRDPKIALKEQAKGILVVVGIPLISCHKKAQRLHNKQIETTATTTITTTT